MKRRLLTGIAVVVALGLIAGGVIVHLTPDHRTLFLIDASDSPDFREVADAVGAAASNMPGDDSLALRRFGGECDSSNTAELVTPGTGQATKIGDAARSITPGGRATLLSGILAAIDDFAHVYPFRGSVTNRVVVVARNGADACGKSADEVRAIIKQHTGKAGVKIDFRFVGHRLTPEQVKVLTDIAAASDAQTPRLTRTSDELVTTMKEVSVPADLVAQEVKPLKACELVTLEGLEAAYPFKPQRLLGFKCYQDRYLLAHAEITHPSLVVQHPEGVPVLFEFRDQGWQYVVATLEPPCSKAPPEAWKQWGVRCTPDPVVCREGQDKVVDMTGVGCPAAIDIADRYLAAIKAQQTQDSMLWWDTGEWVCLRSSPLPLHCTRWADNMTVYIGG